MSHLSPESPLLSPPRPAAAPVRTREQPPSLPAAPWHGSACRSPRDDVWLSPGLLRAPAADQLCSRFALSLLQHRDAWGAHFNLRRDLTHLMSIVGRHLVWTTPVLQALRAFLQQRLGEQGAWAGQASLSHEAFLDRHGQWRGHYDDASLFFHLDDFAGVHPREVMQLLSSTERWLAQAPIDAQCALSTNLARLGQRLELSDAEQAVLRLGVLARYQRELRCVLVECKVSNAAQAHHVLADLAGVSPQGVADALRCGSRLERIGLVDALVPEHQVTDLGDLMKVSDRLPAILLRDYASDAELMAVFTRPAPATALSCGDFAYVREDLAMMTALLKASSAQRAQGINILVYGPPGTGKTELARVAAQAAGLSLYEVESADRDGHGLSGRDRYRSLQISQIFLKHSAGVALLFDEVEDVFPAGGTSGWLQRGEAASGVAVGGKAWVNQLLEHNPVPTFWITNRIDQIDPAFRRRFQFHLELKSPPPGAREALLHKALEGTPVSEAFVARLCARPSLTPAQVHTAARFAQLTAPVLDEPMDVEALIERQLRHADAALGIRAGQAARPVVTQYALDLLNVECRYELPRVIEALRRRGHGTLCLHGAPGTGKTALAEHLAQALDRPLMAQRASDLVSKYVGETEQNMARMFAQAEADGAVLLLDEADSFLQSRQGAERHHEVSEVNEMLQGMERFRGVFVCTTNLFDRLDPAALRRFTFKLRFLPLTPAQRERMFVQEALAGRAEAMDDAWRAALRQLDHLTPGDFAAVRRQVEILGDALDPPDFLEQLQAEHRLKPEVRDARSIGFTAG